MTATIIVNDHPGDLIVYKGVTDPVLIAAAHKNRHAIVIAERPQK